jgi:hypothetical protein
MTAPAEGPVTVTLTDDEVSALIRATNNGGLGSTVERIVAARVAALTADLATARERLGKCICIYGPDIEGPDEYCPQHGRTIEDWQERSDVLQGRIEGYRDRAETAERVIANVRALADEWDAWAAARLVSNPNAAPKLPAITTASRLRALLPAAPTEEQS